MTVTRLLAGRYRVGEEIGRGSMGTVYRAYDEVLRRSVALKEVTFPAGMPPAEILQVTDRTLREARAIAALSHPHVITLFDIVMPESGPVIVMELMVARSLGDIVREDGAVDPADAAVIGAAVASGLMAAHAAGITHRDVKPANVLISDDGRIKLTDFGIARSAQEQTLTATGMLLGSPAYISPEVAGGQPATPAADAWGLGALLFATVEGHPPFDRGDPIATMAAVVSDPVPSHDRAGPLASVIDGLLAKDPGDRMSVAEAHEIMAALAAGGTYLPPSATSAPAAREEDDIAPTDADRHATAGPALPDPSEPAPRLTQEPFSLAPVPTVPPPPWSASASASLAPLPTAQEPDDRVSRRLVVVAVATAIFTAAVGLGWVFLFASLG